MKYIYYLSRPCNAFLFIFKAKLNKYINIAQKKGVRGEGVGLECATCLLDKHISHRSFLVWYINFKKIEVVCKCMYNKNSPFVVVHKSSAVWITSSRSSVNINIMKSSFCSSTFNSSAMWTPSCIILNTVWLSVCRFCCTIKSFQNLSCILS